MVEAAPADRHPFTYGVFRSDKPADQGFTPDVVHHEIDAKYYDDFNSLPELDSEFQSINQVFESTVKKYPNRPFLGQRPQLEDGTFGPYEWMTYQRVYDIHVEIARGAVGLNLFR